MWATRYVRSLLIRDVAGVHVPAGSTEPAELADEERSRLAKAQSRAGFAAGLGWLGILVLFVLREKGREFLPVDLSTEMIFTFGVLAIATHAGFRLGQLEKYRAVSQAISELEEREETQP